VDGFADDWSESIHSITPHVIYTHPLVRDGTVAREGTENRSEIHLAWDELYLYVLAFVEDDVLSAPNTGNQIWRNDAVNLNIAVIGPDGTVSSRPDADDHQLTLSPGDPFEGLAAESWHFVGDGSQFNENFEGNTPVVATHNGGYLLEAAVPWDEIGVFNPQPGDQFGLIVTVFDNDGEVSNGETLQTEIMANTPGAEFQRPQTWGTFSLVDVGVTVSAQALQTSTTAEETTTTSEETTTEAPPEETTIPAPTVPAGFDYAVVTEALSEAGIRSEVRFVPSGTVPADSIAKISPGPGSEIPDGGTVFIEVSTGPPSSGYFLPFERGAFAVGVLSGDPLVTIEEDGSISGPNIDFLLQIGAKLWDDPPEIQYRFLTAAERFEALSTGAIDVLLNGTQRISEVLGFYEVLFPIDGVTQVLLVREEQFALELQRNADRVVIEAAS
jgi:ABC-type amino acid transport substrate-binding protein